MAVLQEVRVETFYTPDRVRSLLRLYPYLLDSRPPRDPELGRLAKSTFGAGGWREEAAAKRADIFQAIVKLEQRDWRAAYCVRARFAVGLSLNDIASYVARHEGHRYHHSTIGDWIDAGIDWMARDLGWDG